MGYDGKMKLYDMPEKWYRASRICRALANPKAYAVLKLLSQEKMLTPSQLARRLHRHPNTISSILRHLRNLDLVRYQRRGRESVYWVKEKQLFRVLASLERLVERTGAF